MGDEFRKNAETKAILTIGAALDGLHVLTQQRLICDYFTSLVRERVLAFEKNREARDPIAEDFEFDPATGMRKRSLEPKAE